MVGETIANFESYVAVAVGLFAVALFAVIVHEKLDSSQQQQHGAANRQ